MIINQQTQKLVYAVNFEMVSVVQRGVILHRIGSRPPTLLAHQGRYVVFIVTYVPSDQLVSSRELIHA